MRTGKSKPTSQQLRTAYFKELDRFCMAAGGFTRSRAILKDLLKYAFSETVIPTRDEIPELRNLQKGLNQLIELTSNVNDAGLFLAISPLEEAFTPFGKPRTEYYANPLADARQTAWDHYPHFLSREEFINPYVVFPKFFGHREPAGWKILVEEFFHAALLHQSVIDFSDTIDNPILLQDLLFQFLEASHLIRVRENYL